MPRPLPTPIRILLVDDHAVVRVGLRNLIEDETDLVICGEATTLAQAVSSAALLRPDVVVLDLRLPDGNGVEAIPRLKSGHPGVKVVVLTSYAQDGLLLGALKAGADGYLLKDVGPEDILSAIRSVLRSGVVMPTFPEPGPGSPAFAAAGGVLPDSPMDDRLTGQERRVFDLVGRGHSNREVATLLRLSEKTVRNYLSRVFEKLGLHRRSQLVARYVAGLEVHGIRAAGKGPNPG